MSMPVLAKSVVKVNVRQVSVLLVWAVRLCAQNIQSIYLLNSLKLPCRHVHAIVQHLNTVSFVQMCPGLLYLVKWQVK